MSGEDASEREDEALIAALRAMWVVHDPVPPSLEDRMLAAVAIDDAAREFGMLSLADDPAGRIRAEGAARTLRFAGDAASVLLHIAGEKSGQRRVDGWSDPPALAARLAQEQREWRADTAPDGRFVVDSVAAGRSCLRVVVRDPAGVRAFTTPWFDL